MDYSTLKHPSGLKIEAVFEGGVSKILCKFPGEQWGIYYLIGRKWCSGINTLIFSCEQMRGFGWSSYMEAKPNWVASVINEKTVEEISCVCDIQTLMMCGCSSSRGLVCRSR